MTYINLTEDLCQRYYEAGYLSDPPLNRTAEMYSRLTWEPFRFEHERAPRYFCREWMLEMLKNEK